MSPYKNLSPEERREQKKHSELQKEIDMLRGSIRYLIKRNAQLMYENSQLKSKKGTLVICQNLN